MTRRIVWSLIAIALIIMAGSVLAGDKPSVDLKWYGYFKFDGAYDRNMTSHGNFVMWVQPETQPGHDNQFNMTANETRFGITATGVNYNNVKVSGKLEFDLYASITGATIAENKAMLQLRHAYFSVESNHWKMIAGQTWDLISPLNPSTLNYSVLWGVGNIGYRRPQLSVWYNFKSGKTTDFTIASGVFRTIGTDLTPTFTLALGETAEGADDGTDAAIPSFQGLIDIKHTLASGGQIRGGVSALTGRLQAETNQGHVQKYKSWVVAGHLLINPTKNYGFSGEVHKGSNLGSYFGNILRSSEVNGSADFGGWVSAWVQAAPKTQLSAGYGMDDPDNTDFASGRSRNSCVYGNVRYQLVPQVTVGLELSNWVTNYKNAEPVKDLRVQSSFILGF
ncbi:conserved exported hypothetical protein [Candidatus Zixiibacteriota bacterium]|nr:conserved exported hypothetical protein [candidate division Zixibacteria bacterium]